MVKVSWSPGALYQGAVYEVLPAFGEAKGGDLARPGGEPSDP